MALWQLGLRLRLRELRKLERERVIKVRFRNRPTPRRSSNGEKRFYLSPQVLLGLSSPVSSILSPHPPRSLFFPFRFLLPDDDDDESLCLL